MFLHICWDEGYEEFIENKKYETKNIMMVLISGLN